MKIHWALLALDLFCAKPCILDCRLHFSPTHWQMVDFDTLKFATCFPSGPIDSLVHRSLMDFLGEQPKYSSLVPLLFSVPGMLWLFMILWPWGSIKSICFVWAILTVWVQASKLANFAYFGFCAWWTIGNIATVSITCNGWPLQSSHIVSVVALIPSALTHRWLWYH